MDAKKCDFCGRFYEKEKCVYVMFEGSMEGHPEKKDICDNCLKRITKKHYKSHWSKESRDAQRERMKKNKPWKKIKRLQKSDIVNEGDDEKVSKWKKELDES